LTNARPGGANISEGDFVFGVFAIHEIVVIIGIVELNITARLRCVGASKLGCRAAHVFEAFRQHVAASFNGQVK